MGGLETLKEKLGKNEEIDKDLLLKFSFPGDCADDEMLVPVDLSVIDKHFEEDEDLVNEDLHVDVQRMIAKLGAKGAAEAFVEARSRVEKSEEPEHERPEPMTTSAWKAAMAEGDLFLESEDGEEELEMDGDELEFDDEEAPEPPTNKAKSD